MKKHQLFIFGVLIFFCSSCQKDFDLINTNSVTPSEVHSSLLLRKVIYDFGENMSYEGFVAGNLLSQHFTAIDFNLFDRHSLGEPQVGGNPWPFIYSNLRDNEIILAQSREESAQAVYEGPALILKAYMTSVLTDIYGDVPYSEAIQGKNGIVSPSYDTQEDIYLGPNGILENLTKGIEAIESYSGAQSLQGDILFDGNLDAWISFANSLKIKSLMRISERQDPSPQLQEIFDSGNFIQEQYQNASFDFTNGPPNNFRMATLRDGDFNLFIMSETMEEILNNTNDPRIEVLFQPIQNGGSDTVFKGLLNGPDASTTSISIADYSLTGTIFRTHTGDLNANFITSWEVSFLLAEAAQRGYLLADPKSLYDKGVELAFEYWHTNLPLGFLSSGEAAFGNNGIDPLDQILTQKWIANCLNGYEGWIEYRRTGYPALKTVSASLNNNLIPKKMPYPTDEEALNSENYILATQSHGNDINLPVWWDVN